MDKYKEELKGLEECGCMACTLCEHRTYLERESYFLTQSREGKSE